MARSDFHPFWTRLMSAMETAGHKRTQTAVADLLKIHQTSVWKWKEGGYPEMARAVELASILGVSVEWLLTGRGARVPLDTLPGPLQDLVGLAVRLSPESLAELRGFAAALSNRTTEPSTKPSRRR